MNSNPNEFILKSEELPILLNILYSKNNMSFNIFPYLIKTNIFKINLQNNVTVKLLVNKNEYIKLIEDYDLSEFTDIVPKFKILRRILISSGFLTMKDWEKIIVELERIKSIDPLKGDRHTFIGMDTNAFINRIYSTISHKFKAEISKFYFVLSRIVKRELTSMHKIAENQFNDLLNDNKEYQKILNELWNGDALRTRNKHIGLVEFNKLRKKSKCLINEALEIEKTREYDFQIIQDFRNQVITQNYDLIILSSDRQVAEQAREPGIKSFFLEIPAIKEMPFEFSGDWHMLCDLLYLTSIYFGVIGFRGNNTSVKLFGLWKGKSASDWDSESLKIQIGSKNISDLLEKQLNIIR